MDAFKLMMFFTRARKGIIIIENEAIYNSKNLWKHSQRNTPDWAIWLSSTLKTSPHPNQPLWYLFTDKTEHNWAHGSLAISFWCLLSIVLKIFHMHNMYYKWSFMNKLIIYLNKYFIVKLVLLIFFTIIINTSIYCCDTFWLWWILCLNCLKLKYLYKFVTCFFFSYVNSNHCSQYQFMIVIVYTPNLYNKTIFFPNAKKKIKNIRTLMIRCI